MQKVISCEIICKPGQRLGFDWFLLLDAVKVAMKFYGREQYSFGAVDED